MFAREKRDGRCIVQEIVVAAQYAAKVDTVSQIHAPREIYQLPSSLRDAGREVGQWPSTDFPATTAVVKAFLWWLALPIPRTPSEWVRQNGLCGHGYTFIHVLSHNLLSHVKENEWKEEKKGMYAIERDVDALRRESFEVTRHIAV